MSRNFLPPLVAILVGIGSGYYAFQPSFRDIQIEKEGLGSRNQAVPQSPDQKPASSAVTTPAHSLRDGSGK
ncbi:hypothetical protein BJX70DRAFT_398387 [Aspergillus crustosus]